MNQDKIEYTLSVFSENQVGMINKIAAMFSRRKISLYSFNSSQTEFESIYRFTIVVHETEAVVKALCNQIDRLVDVLLVYYNKPDEIIWQQQALYKLPTDIIMKEVRVERLLRNFGANAVVIRSDYTVFQVTGQKKEIEDALAEFEKYGLIEFVRGSRIAIMKCGEGIHSLIKEIEKRDPSKDTINNEFLNFRTKVFQM